MAVLCKKEITTVFFLENLFWFKRQLHAIFFYPQLFQYFPCQLECLPCDLYTETDKYCNYSRLAHCTFTRNICSFHFHILNGVF